MKFGTHIFPTDYSIGPGKLAQEAEARGFESIWFPEHSHIPLDHTPYPGGGDLPKQYFDTLDLFVAMAAAAAVTKRINIGSGVCLIPQRDPINTAKAVASLDQISGGRILFGVGAGWNRPEMQHHGADPKTRWKLMRERIEAMQAIWTNSKAEYHGEFVDFSPSMQWPKPVQQPYPPILLGNAGARALERVVRYADEWMPITERIPDLKARLAELKELASEAEREPIPFSAFALAPNEEAVERMAALGATRCIFMLPALPEAELLPLLDKQAKLVEQFADA
ncbi:MAG: LLM class F420-dependent oxidoreductase [Chloroflexi bacterium]|nr:LLM class F420-dependent oxidoreductase [Chloroflexota bacterium]MDA1147186.1 LLM class F420-dependent oxidoreductase [Chloroflexota bacterium]